MKISQHIAALQELQEENGDLDVMVFDYGDIDYAPVGQPAVESDRQCPAFVLLRP